jgi:Glycosyl hydrolase family 12
MEASMRGSWLLRLAAAAVSVLTASGSVAVHARVSQLRTCRTHSSSGVCGPYTYARITNSNGYNTYTDQDMWAANSRTTQTLTSEGPGHWSVVSDAEPAGHRGVQTYPNVQQLFNDWTGAGWNGSGTAGDTPVSGLRSLRSSFVESMPHNSTTIAEAAYDIWVSNIPHRAPNEVMIWVDNVNRGTGGATRIGSATIGRQSFTVLQYGGPGGEIIFSLNRNEHSGTVGILNTLRWLVSHRYEPSTVRIGQVEFGWEICSETTRAPHNKFTISTYSITGVARRKRS